MTKTRAPYAAEFREPMVERVARGRRLQELGREFGCCAQTIHDWIKKAGRVIDLLRGSQIVQASKQARAVANATALSADERAELERLRKENRRLQYELGLRQSLQGTRRAAVHGPGPRPPRRPAPGQCGDAYDNAMAESFFASLECELLDRKVLKTRTQARLAYSLTSKAGTTHVVGTVRSVKSRRQTLRSNMRISSNNTDPS